MKRKGMVASLDDFSRREIASVERRIFLKRGLSLGALTLLTGCDVVDSSSAEEVLKKVSKFNDAVQAWMFNPDALALLVPKSLRAMIIGR